MGEVHLEIIIDRLKREFNVNANVGKPQVSFREAIQKSVEKIAVKSLVEINVDKARQFKQIKKIILVYNKKDSKRVKSLKLKNVKLIRRYDYSGWHEQCHYTHRTMLLSFKKPSY